MELRVLRYFLAVAMEGNITTAANLLHLSQPTLSRQIHNLEDELGQKLLIRKSHRIELTSEGIRFRKRAEEIVTLADKALVEFSSHSKGVSGDIYIGCGETRVLHLLAEVAHELQNDHPGIRFHLHSGNDQDVTERLDRGVLDFGVLISPYTLDKYESLILPEKELWYVLMRKDSPLASHVTIRREDLLDKPLIFSQQAISIKPVNEFRQWFGDYFEQLNIAATFNLIYNASMLVEAGMGYALTIGQIIGASETSKLCLRPMEPELSSELSIIWCRDQVFSPAAELFLQRLRQAFGR